ncbi:hypothetical protein C8R43DRAFT_952252 [Mycena crocata]|nr:hypothetical protein C8R43DRAFT_952252 [Mycena crocata]
MVPAKKKIACPTGLTSKSLAEHKEWTEKEEVTQAITLLVHELADKYLDIEDVLANQDSTIVKDVCRRAKVVYPILNSYGENWPTRPQNPQLSRVSAIKKIARAHRPQRVVCLSLVYETDRCRGKWQQLAIILCQTQAAARSFATALRGRRRAVPPDIPQASELSVYEPRPILPDWTARNSTLIGGSANLVGAPTQLVFERYKSLARPEFLYPTRVARIPGIPYGQARSSSTKKLLKHECSRFQCGSLELRITSGIVKIDGRPRGFPRIYATIAISMFAGATHIRREPVTFADIRPSPSIDHSAQVSNTALGPKIISFLFYDPIATPAREIAPALLTWISAAHGSRGWCPTPIFALCSPTLPTFGDPPGYWTLPECNSLGAGPNRRLGPQIHLTTSPLLPPTLPTWTSDRRPSRSSHSDRVNHSAWISAECRVLKSTTLRSFLSQRTRDGPSSTDSNQRRSRLSRVVSDTHLVLLREWMVSASTKPNFGVKFPIGKSLRLSTHKSPAAAPARQSPVPKAPPAPALKAMIDSPELRSSCCKSHSMHGRPYQDISWNPPSSNLRRLRVICAPLRFGKKKRNLHRPVPRLGFEPTGAGALGRPDHLPRSGRRGGARPAPFTAKRQGRPGPHCVPRSGSPLVRDSLTGQAQSCSARHSSSIGVERLRAPPDSPRLDGPQLHPHWRECQLIVGAPWLHLDVVISISARSSYLSAISRLLGRNSFIQLEWRGYLVSYAAAQLASPTRRAGSFATALRAGAEQLHEKILEA